MTTARPDTYQIDSGGSLYAGRDAATPPTPAALVLTADDTGTVGIAGSALVSNTGGTYGSWSLSASPSGLTPTPSSGSTAAGGSTSISLAYSGAATYSLTLTSAESVTGSPQSIVVSDAPVMPTTATLSGSSTAYTGSAHSSTVTLDEAADQTYTITWSRSDGGTGSATSTITAGNTSASADSTWATTGSRTVDFTISPSLTRAGRPLTVTVSDYVAPAPSASIVQYVTHDGDDVGNVSTSSAPSATMWNTVLQVPWANTNGDWLDATGTEQGSTEWASSAALNALGRYSITVTSLVQRWQSSGLNRGFFLKYSANAFPVTFAGRTAATDADRPKLVVTTALGTFTITARCNAHFEHGSYQVFSGSDEWVVGSGYSAVLQFDLSSIVGAATLATLDVTVTAQDHTGMVLKVFEANPPTLLDPATNATPVTGIGSGTWAALQAHGSTIFADDWRAGGALDFTGGNYEIPHADGRSTDAVTGRTKMAAHIQSGQLLGASVKVDVVESDTAGGVTQAANRRSELYARARMYFDANFASTVERIKIPAIGCQLGYWVTSSGGYWETNLTGGNGGAQATGTKVWLSSINGGAGGWGYSGHSSRLLIGLRNTDTSAYAGLVSVSAYIYNLDQGGPFPAEERFPGGVVLSLGRDYEFEFRQKLNTYTGSTDADGNYATANADGIYQVWINGTLCYDKQTFRWVKHPEFGVQGFWFDVYHGGVASAIAQHDFEMGEMAMATEQIGASAFDADVSAGVWTPTRDAGGVIRTESWNALPENQWVQVAGSQLQGLVDVLTAAGWNPATKSWSAAGMLSILRGYGGCVLVGDEIMYPLIGGHGDGSFNGISKFNVAKMAWDVEAMPSDPDDATYPWHSSYRYATDGGTNTSYTQYPQSTSFDDSFDAAYYRDILPDGHPTARHTYFTAFYDSTRNEIGVGNLAAQWVWKRGTQAWERRRWTVSGTEKYAGIWGHLHYHAGQDALYGHLGLGNPLSGADLQNYSWWKCPAGAGALTAKSAGGYWSGRGAWSIRLDSDTILWCCNRDDGGTQREVWGTYNMSTESGTGGDVTGGYSGSFQWTEMPMAAHVPTWGTSGQVLIYDMHGWATFDIATKTRASYTPAGNVPTFDRTNGPVGNKALCIPDYQIVLALKYVTNYSSPLVYVMRYA